MSPTFSGIGDSHHAQILLTVWTRHGRVCLRLYQLSLWSPISLKPQWEEGAITLGSIGLLKAQCPGMVYALAVACA